jgi:ribonuclease HI
LTVYTDGGCIGNPGKGAWAYLVDDGSMRVEDTDGDPLTTNNKMELQAVIEALTAISKKIEWKARPIRIHTDSQYVRNGITAWIKTWSANGWKTAAKEPVKNKELWIELQKWDAALKPEWKWVKGHAGNPNNERCDQLVRRTMDQM